MHSPLVTTTTGIMRTIPRSSNTATIAPADTAVTRYLLPDCGCSVVNINNYNTLSMHYISYQYLYMAVMTTIHVCSPTPTEFSAETQQV